MAELNKGEPVTLQELMVSTLAMTDALAKLLIEKGVITDAEFKEKLLQKRAVYQSILIQRSIDPGGPPDVVPA
jgi:mannitol/fructose-specific phosphotransferase system IIA component (Ntr-type)